MYAFRTTEVAAERQIVIDRLASGPAVDELMRVLVTIKPGASSMEALRRLSPEAGIEVLAALRGGDRSTPATVAPRLGLFAAFRPYRPAA